MAVNANKLPPNLLALAAALHKSGQLPQAELMYQQALQIEPHNPKVLNYLGVLKSQLGDRQAAIDLISQAVAIEPQNLGYLNNLGNMWAAQDLDRAIATYNQAIAINPNFADSYFNLGIALTTKGEISAAIAAFEQTVGINPQHFRAHTTLGNLLQTQGSLDLAAAHYMQALTIQPESFEALSALGMVFYQKGDLKRSQQAYERAMALNPFSTVVLINLGANFYEQGKIELAAACYREVISISPHAPEAYCNLGMLWAQQGQDQKAIAYYNQALEIAPNTTKALTGLADIYGQRSQWQEAIAIYDHLLQLDPNSAAAYTNLGIAEAQIGKISQSIANFEKAMQIDPKQIKAYAHLGLARSAIDSAIDKGQNSIFDDPNLIKTYQLGEIETWESLAGFNHSLKTYIYEHPTLVSDRLGKPLNKGKQTYEILKDHHKAIATLREIIQSHLDHYFSHCQTYGKNIPGFQFFQNLPKTWELSGWAVVLEPQGFQDPHIHPESFCSGVYYIQVPDRQNHDLDNYGNLSFGLHTSRLTIKPQPGLLVLFPSYFWHSTIPFTGNSDRICISFNIRPKQF